MKTKARFLAEGGIIAALYVLLTLLSSVVGLSSGVIQVRLSEALCILPCFTPAAIPGLFIGCLVSNMITGGIVLDVVVGSITTLMAALITYWLRNNRWLAILPPIVLNSVAIPLVLMYAYQLNMGFWILMLGIAIGEIISVGIIGEFLITVLNKNKIIFK